MTSPSWSELLSETDETRQLERFYAHLTLGDFKTEGAALLAELACRLQLPKSVREHLEAQPPARLLVYRELIRATYRGAILGAMPRACARMDGTFEPLFNGFLANRATASHFLRDITWDFLDYVRCLPEGGGLAPYICELGQLEAIRIAVAAAPDSKPSPPQEPDLNCGLVFSEATRVLSFGHAVHRLPEAEDDRTVPEATSTQLLSYRSPENEVRYLELSPLAAHIVQLLMDGAILGEAVQAACEKAEEPISESVLAGTARLLSDLAQRGVLLRARSGLEHSDLSTHVDRY